MARRPILVERTPVGMVVVSTLIEPLDPDDEIDCTPLRLAYLPAADCFSLAQENEDSGPPDVLLLTREMVEQIVSIIQADELSVADGLKHAH